MAKSVVPSDFDLRHNPKRRGYDLGENVKFSAKPSELLPVWHRTTMPGEKWRISVNHKSRTMPVNTAAYTQIREYFDFFFVPYSYLWKNAKQVHTNNTSNPVVATNLYSNLSVGKDIPHFNLDDFYNCYSASDDSYPISIFNLLNGKINSFGFNRGRLSAKLLNYLGYAYVPEDLLDMLEDGSLNDSSTYTGYVFGSWTQLQVSAYPLLAYNAIYYNFYRNKQWEENVPYNYNVDYLSGSALLTFDTDGQSNYWANPTMFDLRYSNYPKDLFFGVIPDTQLGDVSVVDVETHFNNVSSVDLPLYLRGQSENQKAIVLPIADPQEIQMPSNTYAVAPADYASSDVDDYNGVNPVVASGLLTSNINKVLSSSKAQFDILSFRYSNFLQRYREILGSGDLDYRTIVKKLFDVDVSDIEEGCPRYLGGDSSTISISEVINNNLSDGGEALIKGKGENSASTGVIDFDSRGEYGIIMCIYHCQPVIDYATTGLHFDVTKVESDDYANPVFDQLGFQELPMEYLTTDRRWRFGDRNRLIGFTTRYFDYKTGKDRTLGSFMEDVFNGSPSGWFAPLDENFLLLDRYGYADEQLNTITYEFFKVSPRILDPIFSVKADSSVSTDPLIISARFDVQAVRPLDYHGLPY